MGRTNGRTGPLSPEKLPSPFYHSKDWEQHGLKASLEHRLWEILKQHPSGLSKSEVTSEIEEQDGQVSAALESDDHFTKLSDDKWGLAIYKPLRWGFAGTGLIAEDFIEALSLVPGAQLVTAAARNKDRLPQAQEFAKKHGVKKAVADYEELAQDSEVDIVYVSNIHPAHKDTTLLMLEHGKHVLCEKPLAVNAQDTRVMVEKALQTGLFFSAGLWTRFFPATKKLRDLINDGVIGKVHHFHGQFIAHMGPDVKRMYDINLGGGALLDIGIYPLSIASWVFGCQTPKAVSAMGTVHSTGIDSMGLVNLKYSSDEMASITFGVVMASAPVEGTVHGTKGNIKIHSTMHNPTKLTVEVSGQEPWDLDFPFPEQPDSINHGPVDGFNYGRGLGFVYEAMGVHSAVINGKKQVEDVGRDEMIMLMETADRIREQIGVQYPQDGMLHKISTSLPSLT